MLSGPASGGTSCWYSNKCTKDDRGDWKELARELETAATETRAGILCADRERVADWRRHFAVDRERTEWQAAIEGAIS